MNKVALNWGVAAVACMFSFAASAQMVEVKPRVEEPITRPGLESGRLNVRPTQQSGATSAFSIPTTRAAVKAGTTTTKKTETNECALKYDDQAAAIVKGTSLNYAEVLDTLQWAGPRLSTGACAVSPTGEKMADWDQTAKENLFNALTEVKHDLGRTASIDDVVFKAQLIKNLTPVLGAEQAARAMDSLQHSCQFVRLTAN